MIRFLKWLFARLFGKKESVKKIVKEEPKILKRQYPPEYQRIINHRRRRTDIAWASRRYNFEHNGTRG